METKYSKAQISNAITHWTKVLESMEAAGKPAENVDEGLLGFGSYIKNKAPEQLRKVLTDKFKGADPAKVPVSVWIKRGEEDVAYNAEDFSIETATDGDESGQCMWIMIDKSKPGKTDSGSAAKLSTLLKTIEDYIKGHESEGDTLTKIAKKGGVVVASDEEKSKGQKPLQYKFVSTFRSQKGWLVFRFDAGKAAAKDVETDSDPYRIV